MRRPQVGSMAAVAQRKAGAAGNRAMASAHSQAEKECVCVMRARSEDYSASRIVRACAELEERQRRRDTRVYPGFCARIAGIPGYTWKIFWFFA